MDISELLDRRAITPKVSASSKRQALSLVAETASRRYGLDAGEVLDALMAREQTGSTGVGAGVAVPHARVPRLDRVRAVFLRLETAVDYDALDGQPVDLVFALLAPKSTGPEQLKALASVSRLLRQRHLRQQLREANTPDTIYSLLSQTPQSTAA